MNTALTDQPLVTAGEGGQERVRVRVMEGGRNKVNHRRKDGEIKAKGAVHVKSKGCMNRDQSG